jgi:anti-sigma factor RsiW
MVAPFDPKSHVTDEALELYTLHMLSEAEQEMVEIHLLICDVCQSASDRIDAEIAAIRTSLQQLEDRKVALQQKTSARKIVIFKTLGPK